jgi:hypothetical protein
MGTSRALTALTLPASGRACSNRAKRGGEEDC